MPGLSHTPAPKLAIRKKRVKSNSLRVLHEDSLHKHPQHLLGFTGAKALKLNGKLFLLLMFQSLKGLN